MSATSEKNFGKNIDELEIIELINFDTAFAVSESRAAETKRRFMTMFVSISQTRLAGSSGMVSKAYNAKGEVFAIKRLIPDNTAAIGAAGQSARFPKAQVIAFHEEYQAQLQLSNMKGFPKLYGYGVTKNHEPIIVMEWVDGLTLTHVKKYLPPGANQGTVHPTTVAQLGYHLFSILEGLDRMEKRPVHRDISPSNVMIRSTETPLSKQLEAGVFDLCLIDFGSATIITPSNPNFTMTTNVWRNGTPEYAPPEMLTYDAPNVAQLRQSPSIDVYAASSILYELIIGTTPFQVGSHPEMSPYRRKMDFDPAPLPREFGVLGSAIMGGLRREQAERLPAKTLADMCAAYLRGDTAPWSTEAMTALASIQSQQNPTPAIPPMADFETTHLSINESTHSNAESAAGAEGGQLSKKRGLLIGIAAAVGAAIIICIPYLVTSLM